MKRLSRIKLNFLRNWKLSGKERFSDRVKLTLDETARISGAITWLVDEDISVYIDTNSYIEWSIFSGGTYESEIGKLIRLSLRPGDCALDVGMNIGLQSMRMAQRVTPLGRVYGFEPLDHLRKKAERNFRLNNISEVVVFPFALAERNYEEDFDIDTEAWNQGTFSLGEKSHGNKRQQVVVRAGDDVQELKVVESLKLIKIDVEGYEYNVLKGLKNVIAKNRPRIIFEYDLNYWKANRQDIGECYTFLKYLSYQIFQISSVGCEPIHQVTDIVSGNLFCISDNDC